MSHATERTAGLPPPGRVIGGKYVVERVIGEGGMGAILAARHEQLGQQVAIKVLRAEALGHPEAVARFLREARAAVAIKSEHVGRVIDVGTLDSGVPYMIMEYLEGEDLAELLERRGPLPVSEAVDFVVQACEALAEAHAKRIVHRDIKPANLFLTQRADGSALVKVLDFGIAKALEESVAGRDANLTATATALGTPTNMAPEQVRSAKDVDPRADVWGLGTVLYELIVDEPPFVADTITALCAMIIADPLVPMAEKRSDVPARLDEVVGKALEKEREVRYPSVAALAEALAPFASDAGQVHIRRACNIGVGGRQSLTSLDEVAATPALASTKSGDDPTASHEPASADDAALAETAPSQNRTFAVDTPADGQAERKLGRRMLTASLAVVGAALIAALAVWTSRDGSFVDPPKAAASVAASSMTSPAAVAPASASTMSQRAAPGRSAFADEGPAATTSVTKRAAGTVPAPLPPQVPPPVQSPPRPSPPGPKPESKPSDDELLQIRR